MFVAHTRRPLALFNGVPFTIHRANIDRGMMCLVVTVGAYGQVHASLEPLAAPWSDLHWGFGALLLCTIYRRMRSWAKLTAHGFSIDVHAATRHMVRWVYTLLYALAGLREVTNICVYVWDGGTVNLGWIELGIPGAGSPPMPPNMDSFQIYLSYGFVAIVAIRSAFIQRQA